MTHPLVDQLRFTRSEFKRCLKGLSAEDAAKRIRKAGKAPGILVGEADGQRCLDMGFLFVAVAADTVILVRAADAIAAKFKK